MRNYSLFPKHKKSFGIDLGNTNTVVSDQNEVLLSQPSYIVLDKERNKVKAVGSDAFDMFEKTHSDLRSVKPLRGGVIADHSSATKMIHALMEKVYGAKSFLSTYDNIVCGVPYYTTNVERRALKAVLEQFNARSVNLVYEPVAAAIGMGLNISEPNGKMVVDIGGGITEIVVISLSGIASFQSVKIAGDTMDEEIQRYFRQRFNMGIGLKTAEQVKIQVGSVLDKLPAPPKPMIVRGKDMLRGLPMVREVDHVEVCSILDKSFSSIELAIQQTLEKCPPELSADIYENGIHVTGGNALLRGVKERLEAKMHVQVHIDSCALTSVSKGVAATLKDPQKYKPVLID